MKLVTLNAWGGRSLHPLLRFFRKYKNEVDIFCLQEMFNTSQKMVDHYHPDEHLCGPLFDKISNELENFSGWFAGFNDNPHRQSLSIFIRNNININEVFDKMVHEPSKINDFGSAPVTPRKIQFASINISNNNILIANYHGLWNGPKTDTKDRIKQSNTILKFITKTSAPIILCGDFNLLPDTISISILEKSLNNLIKERNTKSTRTPLYRHYDNKNEPNFADYIFVSSQIKVNDFNVLPDLVSDHSPLYLDFV